MSYPRTVTEYDTYVRAHGVRQALADYPLTMQFKYAAGLGEWSMFYSSEHSRTEFARKVHMVGGWVTGASGGDLSTLAPFQKRQV